MIPAVGQTSDRKSTPELKLLQRGKFRIFYQTEGQHAVIPTDTNSNGIPDQVEDILIQTETARDIFVELMGFQDPLLSERYRGAKFVDIRLRSKESLRSNGLAFDELSKKADGQVLRFDVATSINASKNPTPAHEYFHLIQYSMTYFKNGWYMEGTARWSEKSVTAGGLGKVQKLPSWPLSADAANELYGRKYDASIYFWNPLVKDLDKSGEIPSSVMKDAELTGWKFVRSVFEELGRSDDIAFRELGFDKWSEANQRSPLNNAYIMRAVEKVLAENREQKSP
jgi:hypothetical protein